ncbi:MAG: hypothetical protein ACLTBR_03640 [Anaerostipes sp.]|uniref:hypothetical protein n=1 Tax=Anaerostipes sp. TaxID=1872530 RepID=UPI0039949C7F
MSYRKETLVDIFGEKPNIFMKILDRHGDVKKYHISEMLLDSRTIEEDHLKKKYRCVFYKGRVVINNGYNNIEKTIMFKYIIAKKKWYLCGDASDLHTEIRSPYKYME